jgi:arginine:pyruvate transaminase
MLELSQLTSRISSPASAAWNVGDLAFDLMRAGADIIHLGVGDPDLDTPASIREAAYSAIEAGKTHYAPIAGESGTRRAIANHAAKLYGGQIEAQQIVVFAGAQAALFATFLCIAGPGDEVIVLEPSYATYPAVVTSGGARMVSVVLDKADGYQLDLDKIKLAITPRTKAILINSPGNPSGAVFDQSALNALVHICEKRSIWLVSDEVYWSLCYDRPHTSPYIAEPLRNSIIVVNSLSKSHAMTGWRIGWALGPKHFAEAMTDLAQASQFAVTQFVQEAAITALSDEVSAQEIHSIFERRRNALCEELAPCKALQFTKPSGGMFILADVSRTGLSGNDFAKLLLEHGKVAVVPGFGFGASMTDTVRIGFLCNEDRLREAAHRISAFCNKYYQQG